MERERGKTQLNIPFLEEEGSSSTTNGSNNSSRSVTVVLVLSTFIAVCGSYGYGSASGYSSPAETGIREDLGLSVAEYSAFGSILTIGAMLGAALSGKITDVAGQRIAMGISDIFFITGWLAILFAKVAWVLDLGRLLTGLGVGIVSYVVPIYLADVTPKNLRGRTVNIHMLAVTFGTGMTYVLGTIVSWRILAMIGTIPCLVHLVGLFMIPESPRWLAKTGRDKEFTDSLQRLRGTNADILQEANQIRDYIQSLEQLPKARFFELFQKTYIRSLIVGSGLMILREFGGFAAILYYASSIFEDSGFSTTIGTITLAAAEFLAIILLLFLIDKLGRRPLLMISASGTCLGCLLVGLSFSLKDLESWSAFTPVLSYIGLLVFSAFFGIGLAGIPWLLISEIFPVNMKGTACGLISFVTWFTSWIVSYAFNFSVDYWSSAGTFYVFAGFGGLVAVFVAKMVPETKGKTLEEIQVDMNPLTMRS